MFKKILIVYLHNGSMQSHIEREVAWNNVTKEFKHMAIVREIYIPSKRLVEYEDGTIVEVIPAQHLQGRRVSHLYISESVNKELKDYAKNIVVSEKNMFNLDTEGLPIEERFIEFNVEGNEFITKKGE